MGPPMFEVRRKIRLAPPTTISLGGANDAILYAILAMASRAKYLFLVLKRFQVSHPLPPNYQPQHPWTATYATLLGEQ